MITKHSVLPPPPPKLETVLPGNAVECEHSWTLCKLVYSNDTVHYKRCCLLCGQSGASIRHDSLSDEEKADAFPVRQAGLSRKSVEYYRRVNDRRSAIMRNAYAQANSSWQRWYEEYLQSDGWKDKRENVLRRDGYICQACLNATATQVHHLTYERVGREPLFDLVAVCEECHEQLHERDDL